MAFKMKGFSPFDKIDKSKMACNKPKRSPKPQKKKTKGYIYEVYEYARNQAKWKAAREYCADRMWEFKVLTEDELGIK